jgi:hypothetical protein
VDWFVISRAGGAHSLHLPLLQLFQLRNQAAMEHTLSISHSSILPPLLILVRLTFLPDALLQGLTPASPTRLAVLRVLITFRLRLCLPVEPIRLFIVPIFRLPIRVPFPFFRVL